MSFEYTDIETAFWLVRMLAAGTIASLPGTDHSNPQEVGFVSARFIEQARELVQKVGA